VIANRRGTPTMSGLSKDKNFAVTPPDGWFRRDAIGHREYVFGF